MDIKRGLRTILWISLMGILASGCRPGGGARPMGDGGPTPQPGPATEAPRPTDIPKTLATPTALTPATPYALVPAAGICGGPGEDELATVEIWPDIPTPRCLKVTAAQRLQVVNRTDALLTLRLGTTEVQLPAGETTILEPAVGELLAAGVHVLSAAPFSGPELWLE